MMIRLKSRFFVIAAAIVFFGASISSFAQDNTEVETASEEAETKAETEAEEDKREQVLRFGIDTEVLGVLGDLQRERNDQFNDLLVDVMDDTRNSDIAVGIYALWSTTEWDGGLAKAASEMSKVTEDEDYEDSVVQAAMAYASDRSDQASLELMSEISGHRDGRLAASAIRAIGKIASSEESSGEFPASLGEALLERLKKTDPISEDDLAAALIVTLGDLAFEPSASEMVMIAEDDGSPSGHRRLACISIGKIGRSEDYEVVERLYYESDDATLRSYALGGLAEFPDSDVTDVLVQALKRDSFWRIRVTAAEKLGEGRVDSDIAELLRYKAANDPINHVRIASLKSLGSDGGERNRKFLIDQYLGKNNSTEIRLAALDVLVLNKMSGTPDAINTVMDELWEKDAGRFLEYTCRNLSIADWDRLSAVFERMLDHSSWLIQVYGIRGIRKNVLIGLNGKVNALDADGVDGRVRREVNSGRSVGQ